MKHVNWKGSIDLNDMYAQCAREQQIYYILQMTR